MKIPSLNPQKSILHVLLIDVSIVAGRLANSVDPAKTLRSMASDLGLHYLLSLVCPNTYSK